MIALAVLLPGCLSGCGAVSGNITDGNTGRGGSIINKTDNITDLLPSVFTYELNADGTGYILTDVDEEAFGEVTVAAEYKNLPVVEIGYKAFAHCKNVTGITLPLGVKTVGGYAFENCAKLSSVALPDGLGEIGKWAFSGCAALTGIVIPANVTVIGEYAFRFCRGLESATFAVTDNWCAYWSPTALTGAKPTAAQLGDTSKAASYLKATYNYCLWKRTVIK